MWQFDFLFSSLFGLNVQYYLIVVKGRFPFKSPVAWKAFYMLTLHAVTFVATSLNLENLIWHRPQISMACTLCDKQPIGTGINFSYLDRTHPISGSKPCFIMDFTPDSTYTDILTSQYATVMYGTILYTARQQLVQPISHNSSWGNIRMMTLW